MAKPRTNLTTLGGASSTTTSSHSDPKASGASVPPLAVAVTTRGLKRGGPRFTSTREIREDGEIYTVNS